MKRPKSVWPRRWMLVTGPEREIIEYHRRREQRIERLKARRRKAPRV